MEIYNEDINDLFAVENQKLQIHESLVVSRGQIFYSMFVQMHKGIDTCCLLAWSICCRAKGGNCKQC